MELAGPINRDKFIIFYHYLDHGTNYHVATIAPNRTTEQAIEKLNMAWINWADAATEFNSEQFEQYIQSMAIKSTIKPPTGTLADGKIRETWWDTSKHAP